MADEKEIKEEVVEEKKVEKPKAPVEEPLNVTLKDKDGNKYYWTKKSGMDHPIKVMKK